MKLTLDTEGEAGGLEAREYLAAIVGPFRRPNGRPKQVAGPTNTFVELAINHAGARILFVNVNALTSGASAVLLFSQVADGSNASLSRSETNVSFADFILRPGESLYGAVLTGTVGFTIYTSTF